MRKISVPASLADGERHVPIGCAHRTCANLGCSRDRANGEIERPVAMVRDQRQLLPLLAASACGSKPVTVQSPAASIPLYGGSPSMGFAPISSTAVSLSGRRSSVIGSGNRRSFDRIRRLSLNYGPEFAPRSNRQPLSQSDRLVWIAPQSRPPNDVGKEARARCAFAFLPTATVWNGLVASVRRRGRHRRQACRCGERQQRKNDQGPHQFLLLKSHRQTYTQPIPAMCQPSHNSRITKAPPLIQTRSRQGSAPHLVDMIDFCYDRCRTYGPCCSKLLTFERATPFSKPVTRGADQAGTR